MFTSILIANRGEIARRVMRTAKRMGLRTVAVYSDADAEAAFVREADAAVWIGAAAASDSYLRGDRVIEAAFKTGAEAIHPGYGFLSENAGFAEAVGKAGLAWIGPPPEAIRAMGLKDAAKALMEKHGVPVTPGYHGADQSVKTLKAEARKIGYPVLIKAVAGGGGRGMRRVDDAAGFEEALASAQREAKSSFGDDRVLVEKFIESPRHIEVQVFGDNFGNIIHLFERDCSLQRRRQKVIEEAPAPGMTAEVRKAMTDAAIGAARAVGYRNAGTVEFIVDGSGALRPDGFWFMEMNTRLQVEHPVTESITGLDLVELQLRVASGEKLPAQSDIRMSGHAVEGRLCAEDPARGFLPSSGKLELFELDNPPYRAGTTARLDSAVERGDVVPPAYDSMIAKAVVHAPTREQAFEQAAAWMRSARIWPLTTNAAFLANLLDHPIVRAGAATTALVEQNLDALAQATEAERDTALIGGAVALTALPQGPGGATDPWAVLDGFRANAPARIAHVFEDDSASRTVRLLDHKPEWTLATPTHALGKVRGRAAVEDRVSSYAFDTEIHNKEAFSLSPPDGAMEDSLHVRRTSSGPVVFHRGRAFPLSPPEFSHVLDALAGGDEVRAPMPGKVLDVKATVGAEVKKGAALVVLEAMKMEHTLAAPRDGRIAEIAAVAGAQTAEGVVLVKLEPIPE